MQNYHEHSEIKKRGEAEFQEFNWVKAKGIVDEIDRVLSKHYELSETEVDFIINYDLKYRSMGE